MAKKKSKPKTPSKRWEKYEGGKTNSRFCPRCGQGIFLAKMKGRLYCGKCHYTEYSKE